MKLSQSVNGFILENDQGDSIPLKEEEVSGLALSAHQILDQL